MELGQILYEGPSQLDDHPIVALASYTSQNRKTGPMIQVWIMRSDIPPLEAVKNGADESVCGDCTSRHHSGGGCYVNVGHGPRQVWLSYREGRYLHATAQSLGMFSGRPVRLGAYGDPAAVPFEALAAITHHAGMVTGYTHQIDHPNFDRRHLEHCMVSVESPTSTMTHKRQGLRTFRVKLKGEPALPHEVICPASVKAFIQCVHCGICSGAHGRGKSVVIDAHGTLAKRYERIPIKEIAHG